MRIAKSNQPRSRFLYTHKDGVGDESELHLAAVGSEVIIVGSGVLLEQCVLNQSTVLGAPGVQVRQCNWNTVDAANADMERSGWRDTEIIDSRFTGARLNSSHITRCAFVRGKMNLLQCQMATLQGVRFEDCDLRGAFFNRTTMAGTVFVGSNLSRADFSGAGIAGCDFRRANIEDIRVAPEQLTGVIVTADQALYLARLFGLDIQE